MDKKIIFYFVGNSLSAFSITFLLPVVYALTAMKDFYTTIHFFVLGVAAGFSGIFFIFLGKNHKRRLPVAESAVAMLLIYPALAIFGMIPFLYWLSPLDALLDTVSNLTSAGISLLPGTAEYIFRLWQSVLMWFGSLIFLILLVTIMPEVGGCFGINMSLQEGQNFSPQFGQMLEISKKILKVYSFLTLISMGFFKLAGLNSWDSILMAMRCISTGGGDFFPARGSFYVEYAAIFTMLMACGNFLFLYRLIYTIPPPISHAKENIFRRTYYFFRRLKQNIFQNTKIFFTNSEVKAVLLTIFFGVWIIFFSVFYRGLVADGNEIFRYAFFHAISFLSTTGITLGDIEQSHDFEKFLIFMMAFFGGCMGSVTGGLKMIRIIVLAKVTGFEIKKTMHPQMIESIRVNGMVVPKKIVGRILCFFFIYLITLFVCSAVLSFDNLDFSGAVGMSAACLTNIGILPGICDPSDFLSLTAVGKIFCMIILIIGRMEIFAVLLIFAGLKFNRKNKKW